MDIEYSVSGEFSPLHGGCRGAVWPHSHHYAIEVTATGDLDPVTGMIRGTETLGTDLALLLDQLQFQDMATTLPGASTGSPVGIATALAGHFQARYPRLTEVRIEDLQSGEIGRAKRTPRVL